MKFRALVVQERGAVRTDDLRGDSAGGAGGPLGKAGEAFVPAVEERDTQELPAGELLVRVDYSSLNYKDVLSAGGNRGVTRSYPHTPGIDAAGTVAESGVAAFKEGDEVVVTGFDLGMNTAGGFAEYVRVPASWALKLPVGLSSRRAMMYGTAGLTAAIALDRLTAAGIRRESANLLVTGAKGGVGGFALALLSRNGYEVAASTGTPTAEPYLRALGASSIVAREELERNDPRPLLHARWSAAIDTVGGPILSTVLRSIEPGGAVAACGNAASGSFAGSVYPFILRGVSLLGVDSANYPIDKRSVIWERLAAPWDVLERGLHFEECGLGELVHWIAVMRRGELVGRVIVDLSR